MEKGKSIFVFKRAGEKKEREREERQKTPQLVNGSYVEKGILLNFR